MGQAASGLILPRLPGGFLPTPCNTDKRKVLVLLTNGVNDAYDDNTYPGKYRHGRITYRRDYGSQYTGYGRAGTGTAAPVGTPRRAICQIGGSRVSRATARTAMY